MLEKFFLHKCGRRSFPITRQFFVDLLCTFCSVWGNCKCTRERVWGNLIMWLNQQDIFIWSYFAWVNWDAERWVLSIQLSETCLSAPFSKQIVSQRSTKMSSIVSRVQKDPSRGSALIYKVFGCKLSCEIWILRAPLAKYNTSRLYSPCSPGNPSHQSHRITFISCYIF